VEEGRKVENRWRVLWNREVSSLWKEGDSDNEEQRVAWTIKTLSDVLRAAWDMRRNQRRNRRRNRRRNQRRNMRTRGGT